MLVRKLAALKALTTCLAATPAYAAFAPPPPMAVVIEAPCQSRTNAEHFAERMRVRPDHERRIR